MWTDCYWCWLDRGCVRLIKEVEWLLRTPTPEYLSFELRLGLGDKSQGQHLGFASSVIRHCTLMIYSPGTGCTTQQSWALSSPWGGARFSPHLDAGIHQHFPSTWDGASLLRSKGFLCTGGNSCFTAGTNSQGQARILQDLTMGEGDSLQGRPWFSAIEIQLNGFFFFSDLCYLIRFHILKKS